MKKLPLVAAAAGGVLLLALAGCTASGDAVESSATATAEATTGATDYTFPEVAGECIDGTATVGAEHSSSIITVGDCENVVVEASNSKIVVGAVTNLTLNSSISLVESTSVARIVFGGQGNTVITPGEPALEGDVENNTVSAEPLVTEPAVD